MIRFLKTEKLYEVEGAKAAKYLQGQLSNSITDIPQGSSRYSFLLTNKGKIQAELYVHHMKSGWYLSLSEECEEIVVSHLQKLGPLSGVTLRKIDAEEVRIKEGVPAFGVDFGEEHLAQEAGRPDALHFDKGCYLGQEVVARIHFKGHVNKELKAFSVSGHIEVGDEILNGDGKVTGLITSALNTSEESHGIGFFSYKDLQAESQFRVHDSVLTFKE